MRRYLIFGLMVFGFLGCASNKINLDKNETTKQEDNTTKKIIVIDLDKEVDNNYAEYSGQQGIGDFKESGLRGDKDKAIPIFIADYKGDNDEVALKGEVLKRAKKIKVGDNDEVAFSGQEYRIKTSELKDGDEILLKDRNGTTFITMKIRAY